MVAWQSYNNFNANMEAMPLKQTIYVDVLVGVNLFINYFLLLATAKFLLLPVKRKRLVLASAVGALYSLTILLPEISPVLSVFVKLLMSASIIWAAFGYGGINFFIKKTAVFYIINFAFAGLMMALWYFLSPSGLIIRNSVVYFDISPLLLIVLTVLCYLLVTFLNRITGRQMPKGLYCRVSVKRGNSSCVFSAKVDTGNSLKEPFSGNPVVVAYEKAVSAIIPPEGSIGFRAVPYGTVSGEGILKAFKPDEFTVLYGKRKAETKNVYIAVSKTKPGDCDALLNPELLGPL